MPIDERMVAWDKPEIDDRMVSWDKKKPKETYDVSSPVASMMNIAQSLTFGFGDEIAGAMGADKEKYRNTVDQFKEDYPWSAGIGSVSGSMLLPFGLGRVGGGGLAAQMGTAATTGFAAGALQGAGDAKTAEDMPNDASRNAIIGGVAAPLMLGIAKPVGSIMGALGSKIPFVGDDIANAMARRRIATAFERDSVDANQVGRNMADMNAEARFADGAGENTRTMLDLNATLPGKTQNDLEGVIRNRIATRPERMDDAVYAVNNGMGRSKDVVKALTEQQRAVATPLYQKAHAQMVDADQELIDLLNAAKSVGAFGEAKVISTAERNKFTLDNLSAGTSQKKIDPLTNVETTITTPASKMSIRDLDYVKRGLDAKIEANMDEFGKLNSKGRAFLSLKNDLLSKVDALSPDFSAARQAFAGPEALKTATARGKMFWNEKADRLDDIVTGMTQSEQDAFRVGAGEALREMVGSQPGQNKLLDVWKNRVTREKLQALLGSDVKYSEVEKLLKTEMTLKRLEGLGRGSQTAKRLFAESDQAEGLAQDAAALGASVAKGSPFGVLSAIRSGANRIGTPEPVRDAIGKILLKQYSTPEIKALMEAQEAIRRIRSLGATGSGVAAGKGTSGLLD